ncbi:MAG: uracil-DNA glycosylase [Croceimicrobium sp.]
MVFYEALLKGVHPGWHSFLNEECSQDYFKDLMQSVMLAQQQVAVFPPEALRFHALHYFPPADTKVLILGQDPYHGPGQANGLAFSVAIGQNFPPSLRNIFKELKADVQIDPPFSGDLSPWAKQGVLLLNSALSVEQSKAGAHLKWGWELFTDRLIQYLSRNHTKIVFVLWGNYAQKKKELIDLKKHFILESVHPSPLSAHRGFFGSKPFSKINSFLEEQNRKPIQWQLD